MAKNNWYTEEDLYDVIKSNNFLHTLFDEAPSRLLILEQQKINDRGDRPDFIVFHENKSGEKTVFIVEVKITATTDVFCQLKKYHNSVFESCANNFSSTGNIKIWCAVMARYFDSKITPYFEDCYLSEISFHRLDQDSDGTWVIDVESSVPPKTNKNFDQLFLDFMGAPNGKN